MKLIGMTKTIQDPKTQFNKQVETLKRSQGEMKMELKSSITQLEHSRESLTGRMDESECGTVGLEVHCYPS